MTTAVNARLVYCRHGCIQATSNRFTSIRQQYENGYNERFNGALRHDVLVTDAFSSQTSKYHD